MTDCQPPMTARERNSADAPFPAGSVVLITGIMGAGKSTVAQLLAERLPKAAHVRGDVFRRMVVSGRADMVPAADEEAIAQLHLRYHLAALVADGYAGAGFTAVYQDIVLGEDLAGAADRIQTRPLYVVVLAPRPEVVLRRAEMRSKVSGYGPWTVETLDRMLRETPPIGLWLDTSEQTGTETVDQILRRADDAGVG
jgi:chloramphenicol 3-O-phosphotransferase